MRDNHKGYTLIELIVVMGIFMTVMMITASSFKTILEQSSKLFRSEESNIEGMIGLEMLRHDLQQAGFGLFSETAPVNYLGEASSAPANLYNDFSVGNEPPRPIVVGDNLAAGLGTSGIKVVALTDYLAIKATSVSTSKVAQKWTYLEFTPPNIIPHSWASGAENLASNDKVALLRRQLSAGSQSTSLVEDPEGAAANSFYFSFSNSAFSSFSSSSSAIYTAYGVDDDDLRMPFNRTDYFVGLPVLSSGVPDPSKIPGICVKDASGNPSTAVGTLYKTTVRHDSGGLNYFPILDCVADMQVVLGWDLDGDGSIDSYTNADGSACNPACPPSQQSPALDNLAQDALSKANNASAATKPNIRNSLKMVKVYVLAQNGRRDSGYTSPPTIVVGDAGEISLTKPYSLTSDMLNYRWKVYRIVVRPKNLTSNQ